MNSSVLENEMMTDRFGVANAPWYLGVAQGDRCRLLGQPSAAHGAVLAEQIEEHVARVLVRVPEMLTLLREATIQLERVHVVLGDREAGPTLDRLRSLISGLTAHRTFRYSLRSTGYSSQRYGVCEVCHQPVSDVFSQTPEQYYDQVLANGTRSTGWIMLPAKFGHEQCLTACRPLIEGRARQDDRTYDESMSAAAADVRDQPAKVQSAVA